MDGLERARLGRFQLGLRQLVLVTLAAGVLLGLNMGMTDAPSAGERTYGWPFVMYVFGQGRAYAPSRGGKEAAFHGYAAGVGVEHGGRATVGARRLPGLQFDGLAMDLPFWLVFLALAWVIGDQSSLSKAVRDRLRKVKRRVSKDDGAGPTDVRGVRV